MYHMRTKETERKNKIRFHVNSYDLFGNPQDLIEASSLIHMELININRNYEKFLWYTSSKKTKRNENTNTAD